MTRRIYNSPGGGYPAFTVVDNYIYSGSGTGTPLFKIVGNKIYKGVGGGYPIYELDGNRVYEQETRRVKYRIDGNHIYSGESGAPLYTMEAVTQPSTSSCSRICGSSPSSKDSVGGVPLGSAVGSILIYVISISVAIYFGRITSSFGIGFIVFCGSIALFLWLFGGFKNNIGGILTYILCIIITLCFMNS